MKQPPVCWNVYYESLNGHEIKVFNIFDHWGFIASCADDMRKLKDDKAEAKERVRRNMMYCFWSKCEYEIVLKAWVDPRGVVPEVKIDVYDQVYNNYDIFFEYVWEHKSKIISYVRQMRKEYPYLKRR